MYNEKKKPSNLRERKKSLNKKKILYRLDQKTTMNTSAISNGHDENEIDQEINLNEPPNMSMDSQNRVVGTNPSLGARASWVRLSLIDYFLY